MSEDLKTVLEEIRSLREAIEPRLINVEKWQANADGKITMFGLICSTVGAGVVGILSLFKH